jgi:HEAT repeat protein
VLCTPALARDIPEDVVRTPGAITGPAQAAIDGHVKQFVPDLIDSLKRAKAKGELNRPFLDAQVTVSFRQAYSRTLLPEIEPLLQNPNDAVAITALIITGNLATEQSSALLLPQVDAKLASVRYGAAAAIGITLHAAGNSAPAIRPDTGVDLVRALEKRLGTETDAAVVHRLVLSLREGINGPNQADLIRAEAMRALCRAVDARLRQLGKQRASDELLETFVLAGSVARDGLTGGKTVPADVVKLAGGMGGQMIAYTARLVNAGVYPAIKGGDDQAVQSQKRQARVLPGSLVAAGEAVVHFARVAGGEAAPARLELATPLKEATNPGDATFLTSSQALIGPNGALTKDPFNFQPSDFPTK